MNLQNVTVGERFAEFLFPKIRERRNVLERAADTDELTGLSSRAAFQKAKATAERDANIAFIVFDCNNFGRINKEMSFSFGDEILTVIADNIKRAAKAMRGRAFRVGGDEFVVLCEKSKAVFLRDAIERKVGTFDFDNFKVSISGFSGATFETADAGLQKRKAEAKKR